jgi:hypothetical protein
MPLDSVELDTGSMQVYLKKARADAHRNGHQLGLSLLVHEQHTETYLAICSRCLNAISVTLEGVESSLGEPCPGRDGISPS